MDHATNPQSLLVHVYSLTLLVDQLVVSRCQQHGEVGQDRLQACQAGYEAGIYKDTGENGLWKEVGGVKLFDADKYAHATLQGQRNRFGYSGFGQTECN